MSSSKKSVPSSAEQVTDLSGPPRGYLFHGYRYKLDWPSVEHLLGKIPDYKIAERLGCSRMSVYRMRKTLRIPRWRKSDSVIPLLGKFPDRIVAELRGVSKGTVFNMRKERGIPPAPAGRRKDLIRVRHERAKAYQKEHEEKHGQDFRVR